MSSSATRTSPRERSRPFRISIKKSRRMDVIASLRVFGNGIKALRGRMEGQAAWEALVKD